MIKFCIYIDSVDGETMYSMGSPEKKRCLEFLDKYDHEGSSISMVARETNGEVIGDWLFNEAVYNFLQREMK